MPVPAPITARTPRLSLPFLFPAQAQKEAFVNEALVRIDAMIQPAVSGDTAAPPADPVAGECHIVADNALGAWAGQDGAIAVWAETHWLFLVPGDGAQVFDRAAGSIACYRPGEGWQRATAPGGVSGGTVQDAELRAAFATVVEALQLVRIFA